MQTNKIENGNIVAVMKTTNWTMTIKLFTELVPRTTLNFMWLAQKGYYDGIIFHRIIKDFMLQWWDPTGTGMGWESIYWEKFDDEFHPELTNIPGSLSMANAGPNTNWSQFFINEKSNNFLDNKHSVFWQVIEWEENIKKISKVKTDSQDKPEKEVKIINISLKEYNNGIYKDYKFDLDKEMSKIEERVKEQMEKQKELNKSREVKNWDTIAVHYIWTLENWDKFDSSYDRDQTLEFTVWGGQMIAWFDKAVVWMKMDENKKVTLEPKDAYWEYLDTNVQVLPREQLKSFEDAWIKLEVWEDLPTQFWVFKIKDVDWDNITINTNHKLAWKTLTFDIDIIEFLN